ncbi:MAG: hypothetical protein WCY90_01490 [Bacilli bacterium]
MKRLKDNLKLHAIVVIDDFLSALNDYDGQSLYLANYNITFINYLKHTFFTLSADPISNEDKNIMGRKARQDHPLIYSLYRIFEHKTLQKAHITELETLLKKHRAYPFIDFLNLFTKFKKGSVEFNKSLITLLKKDNLLTKLWLINSNLKTPNIDSFSLLSELSTRGVTKASRHLLFASIKETENYDTISKQINIIINQDLYKDEKAYSDLYLSLAASTSSYYLKIKILKDALKLKYYDALIPLVRVYLTAKEQNNESLLEAYRYLVIAEFLNIDGHRELYKQYKIALRERKK